MNKILPKICLKKTTANNYYRKDHNEFLVTIESDFSGLPKIHTKVRGKKIDLESITLNSININKLFIEMLNTASTIDVRYDNYHLQGINGLNHVATNFTNWDCVPTNLLVSSSVDIPELSNETFIVHTKPCTCSSIINDTLIAEFVLNVIKFESDQPKAFMLSTPENCGLFKQDKDGISMVIKTLGCRKIEFV
jgi:hypothetical protein